MRVTINMGRVWFSGICLLALAILLVSCGAASNSSNGGGAATPSPTTVKGYGTTNGCPSDAVVSSPPPANVTVRVNSANQTITAHNGNIIEIHLPFGQKWTGPATTPGILELQQPAGYAQKTGNVCVWRFVARGTGTAQIGFYGRALCKPGTFCPMYVTNFSVNIHVQ